MINCYIFWDITLCCISQKIDLLIITAERASHPTFQNVCNLNCNLYGMQSHRFMYFFSLLIAFLI